MVFVFFCVLDQGRGCTHSRRKHGASFEKDFWCKTSSEIMLWEKQEEEKKKIYLLRLSSQRDYSVPHYLKKNKSPKAQTHSLSSQADRH